MLALMPLLREAGVPDGLVNVLPSRRTGPLVEHLLHDPRVRAVSFTGSTEVGRRLLKVAADQVLKPAMELGGNAPLIVLPDADLDVAVEGAMLAKMRNLGEACTAANRFYVHEGVAEAFTEALAGRMAALKVGDGSDPSVDVGPLVNAATRDKVAALVEDAVSRGARVVCGGAAPGGPGFFYPPTVLADVPEDADCVAEEIFGPVAAVQTFTDVEDAIRRANDTEYGLVAYVFTGDFRLGMQVCERLDYGMVGLNRGLVSDPAAPFGGTKQSGLGREGGHEGMLEFMETQYIAAEW
jgi:succinate-semialdehyde dehydrogenase/glutarate-semialdehyde dehydrogenase